MSAGTDIAVADIQVGDEFWHEGALQWRAIGNATKDRNDGAVAVDLQVFPDGGLTTRRWAAKRRLTVRREG